MSKEVQLLGSFILPTLVWSETHLDAMCFRCEPLGTQAEPMLVPVVSSVPVYPADLDCSLRIIGTLRNVHGQHVFEMCDIKRQKHDSSLKISGPNKYSKNEQDAGKLLGRLVRISPVLRMQFGRTVFIELELNSEDTSSDDSHVSPSKKRQKTNDGAGHTTEPQFNVFVALLNQAVLFRPYLQLGCTYLLTNTRRSHWKSTKDGQSQETEGDCWYAMDKVSSEIAPQNNTTAGISADSNVHHVDSASSKMKWNINCEVILSASTPKPDLLKYTYIGSHNLWERSVQKRWSECSIVGRVDSVDKAGSWVLLAPRIIASDSDDEDEVQVAEQDQEVRGGALYIFLSHYSRPCSLHACFRSGCEILANSVLPIFLWGKLIGFAVTMRSHLSVKSYGEWITAAAKSSNHGNAPSIAPSAMLVPRDQRRCCHMYSAWKVCSERRLKECVPSQYYDSFAEKLLLCLQKNQSSESTVGTSILANTTKEGNSLHRENPTFSSSSAPPLLPLPDNHSIQAEFCDRLYTELYSVRGGEDADAMAARLPQPLCVSQVKKHCAVMAYKAASVAINSKFSTLWQESRTYEPVALVGLLRRAHIINQSFTRNDKNNIIIKNNGGWRWGVQNDETDDSDSASEIDNNTTDDDFSTNIEGKSDAEDGNDDVLNSLILLTLEDAVGATIGVLVQAESLLVRALGSLLAMQPIRTEPGHFAVSPPAVCVPMPAFLNECEPAAAVKRNKSSRGISCIALATEGVRLVKPTSVDTVKIDVVNSNSSVKMSPPVLTAEEAGFALAEVLGVQAHIPISPRNSSSTFSSTSSSHQHNRPACSVRHALMDIRAVVEANITLTAIEGTVVSKELTIIDTEKFQSYKNSNNKNTDRCAIILQDLHAADTIKAYIPLKQGRALLVGMKVRLESCTLVLSAAGTAYINGCNNHTKSTDVLPLAVLGMVPLQHLSAYCRSSSLVCSDGYTRNMGENAVAQFTRGIFTLPKAILIRPPMTLVSSLVDTRLHNRCQWRLLGRVVCVEKVHVLLRCADCNVSVGHVHRTSGGARSAPLLCPRCSRGQSLVPEWTAVLSFDDGSGECFLHVDSANDVFEFLQPNMALLGQNRGIQGSNRDAIKDGENDASAERTSAPVYIGRSALQEAIEDYVRVHGHIKYIHQYRQSKRRANQTEQELKPAEPPTAAQGQTWQEESTGREYLTSEEILQASTGSGTGAQLAEEERMLDEFIEECDLSAPMEVDCRLIFLRGSRGQGVKTLGRNIRIQVDNADKPWNSFSTGKETLRTENLSVQVTAVRSLGRQGVHEEAWRQLRSLNR
jgi:hypothetical protein